MKRGKGVWKDGVEGGSGSIDAYDGVKQASEYLKQQGVPRQYRKQILESFDVGTIKLETAGDSIYGLRFYGGNANAEGRYLFETFSPLTNRKNLALPYEWNDRYSTISGKEWDNYADRCGSTTNKFWHSICRWGKAMVH